MPHSPRPLYVSAAFAILSNKAAFIRKYENSVPGRFFSVEECQEILRIIPTTTPTIELARTLGFLMHGQDEHDSSTILNDTLTCPWMLNAQDSSPQCYALILQDLINYTPHKDRGQRIDHALSQNGFAQRYAHSEGRAYPELMQNLHFAIAPADLTRVPYEQGVGLLEKEIIWQGRYKNSINPAATGTLSILFVKPALGLPPFIFEESTAEGFHNYSPAHPRVQRLPAQFKSAIGDALERKVQGLIHTYPKAADAISGAMNALSLEGH